MFPNPTSRQRLFTPDFNDKSNLRTASRSNEKLRTQMLSRLSYDKIWLRPQDKPKQSQTAIIFDWDDTILPTSILTPYEYLLVNT